MRKSADGGVRHRAAMVAMMAAVSHASAANAAAGCRVDYVVTTSGPAASTPDIAVTNLGEPVNGWTLRFAFPAVDQQIAQTWSATWAQAGQQVSATNLGWNATLGTNGSGTSVSSALVGRQPRAGVVHAQRRHLHRRGPAQQDTDRGRPPHRRSPTTRRSSTGSARPSARCTPRRAVPLAATATVGGGHYITSVSFRVDGVTVAQGVRTTGDRLRGAVDTPTGACPDQHHLPAGRLGRHRPVAVRRCARRCWSLW